MNTQARLLALVALLAVPTLAFSQPYANVQLGYARADFAVGPPYNGVVKDNAPMVGIEAGYAFGKWGAELGLNDYGSLEGFGTPCTGGTSCPPTTQTISGNDQSLYKVTLVRRFEIGDNVRLFGKAGYYHATLKTNVPGGDFHPEGLVLGVGARWYFSSPWSLASRRRALRLQRLSGFAWRRLGLRPRRSRQPRLPRRLPRRGARHRA